MPSLDLDRATMISDRGEDIWRTYNPSIIKSNGSDTDRTGPIEISARIAIMVLEDTTRQVEYITHFPDSIGNTQDVLVPNGIQEGARKTTWIARRD
jgi:hypothetical protein